MKTRQVAVVSGLRTGVSGGIRTVLSGSFIALFVLFASGGIAQIPYRGKTLSPPVHVTRQEHGNYGPVLTPKATANSQQKAAAANKKSPAQAAVPDNSIWKSLGPAALNAPNNKVGVFGGSYASGRITGIAVNPTNSSNIYIAAAGGGVWNTTDGATWIPLTDNQATLSMGSITIAPTDSNVIYAGTGEANNSADSNHGMGILVSNNGGSTWTLSQGPGGVFNGLSVGKIAIDPTNAQTAYAAMNDEGWNGGCYAIPSNCSGTGVYKTSDGGQTWLRVTPTGGFSGDNTWSDVVVDPDTPTIIYAAEGNYVLATQNGVYRSVDSGATWQEFAGVPNGNTAYVGRIALAAGTGHVLYVAMAYSQDTPLNSQNQSFAGYLLYMGRIDAADAQSPNSPTVNDLTPQTPNFCGDGQQGWYDLVLGVDPSDNSHVFAAGAYDYHLQANAILESTTSAESWNDITTEGGVEPHTDYHAMAFDSSNRLLVGNDGGIWRYDGSSWTNLNGDLNTIQFYGISLHPTNPQIMLGGSQDNGSEIYTDNPVWNAVTGGDGGYANISQTNPNVVMYTTYTQGVTFGTVNGGITWPQIFPYPGLTINSSLFNFITPTVADPLNGDRLLIGGDYIWETLDDGADWFAHTNPSGLPVDSLAVKPAGNTIYIATGGTFSIRGFVYRSDDDGNTWTAAGLTTSNYYHMHEVDIDPNDPTGQTAVVVIDRANPDGHIFRTTNGGGGWTDISGDSPAVPTWSAKIDIDANQTIYVSNDTGVYSSPSPYVHWSQVGTGLPNAQGFNLQLNENPHELGLATHGRGAWLIGSLGISKTFNPTQIEAGQTSVVTLTLTNTTGSYQNPMSFTDNLVNMQAVGGAVTGTCAPTPATLAAGATALTFSGIALADQSTCTIIFTVTSNTPGIQANTTSGVTAPEFSTPLPSLPSNPAELEVLAPPTIAKAFLPISISSGNTSVVTLTLSNINPLDLTSGAFTDTLVHMSAVGGAVGGTCVGTTPNTLAVGATALSFTKITIPAESSCTVTFSVTSNVGGAQPNTTSGVTTTLTPVAGLPSNSAVLTVVAPPTISKGFNPASIASGANSLVTLTLSNSSPTIAFTGGAFTDTLVHMSAVGGVVGGTCVGTSPNTLAAGATALSFSGITIPANNSCTVNFSVTSANSGGNPNTTSGVTTTQTTTPGAASNTATLTVSNLPTIAKAFNPPAILPGTNSVVTLTLSNSSNAALTGGSFTDNLVNMSAFGGAVGGTCAGTSPANLSGGATSLSFSGITIPASGSCTVTFTVTSTIVGTQTNTTSGVTTTQSSTAGPVSNTANLYVLAVPTITKAFNPQSIISGTTSLVTLTLANTNAIDLAGGAVTDTLANMSAVTPAGAVGGTCVGTTPNIVTAGATALSFSGITIPANSTCTVTFNVTSTILGAQPNTTSGVKTTLTPTAGPASNTPSLIVYAVPTITKAFNPAAITTGGTSVVTLTLTSTNPGSLVGANFSDTLVNMSAVGGSVTGTCVGTTPNTLAAGATNLGFGAITLAKTSSCTVIFSVTSSTLGVQNNTTTGVTTSQTTTAGPPSNTATLTVSSAPTISKAFNPVSISSGGNSLVNLTLSNSNASVLTGGAFTDTLANMSAVGGAVGGTCVGTTPNTLAAGATALSFTGITIPASGNCTVIFHVTSSTVGGNPNTTSGVTTTQTPTAGTASNTATLTVTALATPTIAKAFNPVTIQSGGNSAVTLTLSNSNASALSGGAFTDALTNMSALGGAVTGTCAGTTPNTLAASATALSFTGITIPASSNCTVIFSVTSATTGAQTNKTSGVTTTQTPAAGTASNTATLTVLSLPTIAKGFNPAGIASGGNSVVTLTLSNGNGSALTGGALTDTLANMSALGGAVTGTCAGTAPNTLAAGATALSFTGITIPASSSCTVIFSVTSSTVGGNPNTTSGVTTTQTPTAGTASNTATLTVTALATPTIAKAFNPVTIASGGNSAVTLTLSNSNASALSGGAFTDALTNMSALGGAVTGTCAGTAPNTLAASATALSFTGITIPASSSCTVIFSVTSSTAGAQTNKTSGVTTTQTPAAGAASNTATLTVLSLPTIAKGFNPAGIASGGNSVVTLTLSNGNASALTGGAFTDTLANMSALGGAVTGTCAGTTPNTLVAGATALSFTGITIPANSNCTVIFSVTSSTVGGNPNTTSGVTTTQTPTAGTASNTATLTVTALATPTIAKAFNPVTIQSGGNSAVTLTLSNSNASALTGGAFTDALTNMSALGGAVTGTCVGTTPNTLAASATALSFTGITIPASSSCTVIFSVTSSTAGAQTNKTSGVTTTQTPAAGAASNTATLTVLGSPTIGKAFNPAGIASGGNSVVTLTLSNGNGSALTGGAFTDTLANMSALGGAVTGTCAGTAPNLLAAGATALSFTGITVPASSSCTVIFSVTSSTVGGNPNTTSGVTTTQTPTAGTASNTATLTVTALATPTIAKAFNPVTIQSGGNSAVTLTLSNGNVSALTGGAFTDTLVHMSALGGAVTGTCAGTTPNTLAAGATALSFTGITIPASSSCTVIFNVTSSTVGGNPNTTSGVTTTQTPAAGAASNTATLTVLGSPAIVKAFNPGAIASGGNSVVTLTLSNGNASALTGGAFTDTLANMSALGGAVTGTCAGTAPNTLAAGATALSFTGITIPANSNCAVIFSVTSSTVGGNPNTTSGVTTTQTPTAGTASNTATLTVTASGQPTDVSGQVKVTTSGLVFSRATGTFNGTLTITNIGATAIAAPLQSVFTNLVAGATLVSRTGTVPNGPYAGAPYMTVPGGAPLAPGASVTIQVKFTYANGSAPISYVSKTLSGAF